MFHSILEKCGIVSVQSSLKDTDKESTRVDSSIEDTTEQPINDKAFTNEKTFVQDKAEHSTDGKVFTKEELRQFSGDSDQIYLALLGKYAYVYGYMLMLWVYLGCTTHYRVRLFSNYIKLKLSKTREQRGLRKFGKLFLHEPIHIPLTAHEPFCIPLILYKYFFLVLFNCGGEYFQKENLSKTADLHSPLLFRCLYPSF